MLTIDKIESFSRIWLSDSSRREKNKVILEIFNKNLMPYIHRQLQHDGFHKNSIHEILSRCLPLNILRKTTKKLAKSYNEAPLRIISGGQSDKKILDNLLWETSLDRTMAIADKYLCLFDEYLLNPFYNSKKNIIDIRVIPSHMFTVVSTSKQTPNEPDVYITAYGKNNFDKELILIFDDDSFTICDTDGKIDTDEMSKIEQPAIGENIYGIAPYVYVNKIDSQIQPIPDESDIKISTLVPILFGDLNFSIKYQAFSSIWGKNIDMKNFILSPNSTIELKKKNPMDETEPEIGTIKPEIDMGEVLNTILSEIGIWLSTKGLRPTTVSTQGENFSSGFSKMIDEADTYEERLENMGIHREAEKQLFDLLLHYMLPVISEDIDYNNKGSVSNFNVYVTTVFKPIEPLKSKKEIIEEQILLLEKGLTSTKAAMKRVNPELTDEQIDVLLLEIEEENKKRVIIPILNDDKDNDKEEEEDKEEDKEEE